MARRSLVKKGRTADAERQKQGRQEQQEQGRRELRMVAVGDLAPAPWNARGKITPESVADLTASIKTLGLIEPLVASEAEGRLTLIAGHRRLAACREAGMESVPVWVMEGVSADRARRMTLIENLQREDADPLMESELAWSLVNGGMTEAEIAAETGRGQRWVARRLRLSNLGPDWRARVRAGEAITTDCLEHIAAYPIEIQKRLRKETGWPPQREGPMRWEHLREAFSRETHDLREVKFDTAECKRCSMNTGSTPELFDWVGKPRALGKCLNAICFAKRVRAHEDAIIERARSAGSMVIESRNHPDRSIKLRDERGGKNDTLYVWTEWDGSRQMAWGARPRVDGQKKGGMTKREKAERQATIARNKALRKFAAWCGEHLADVISTEMVVGVRGAIAIQRVFDIGCRWQVLGARTNVEDVEMAWLIDPGWESMAPMATWVGRVAELIVDRLESETYAARLIAILPSVAEQALTEDERRLIVTDSRLDELRTPPTIDWIGSGDSSVDGADQNEEEAQ